VSRPAPTLPGLALALGLAWGAGCAGSGDRPVGDDDPADFPAVPGGKTDVFGRSLVGVAAPYEPDPALAAPEAGDQLAADVRRRRGAPSTRSSSRCRSSAWSRCSRTTPR